MLRGLSLVAFSALCLTSLANGALNFIDSTKDALNSGFPGQNILGPVSTLTVANHIIAPDGFKRSAVLVNGVYPAPLIQANKTSRYLLEVVNRLNNPTMQRSTSVHWHGVFNNGTNYADGTSIVTQCPITPGDSFLYDFFSPEQTGTYWYHSHFRVQYCDGLRGPFVIYDPQDPHRGRYDVDDAHTVITLGEWYHLTAPEIVVGGNPAGNSTLINGKGRYVGGPKVPLAIVNVQAHKRYRMRLFSISCDPFYIFSIDNHRLTIIEAEGTNTYPLTVDNIMIHAGQRYSFILNANQPIGNYWIRALPSSGFAGLSLGFANATNSAILRYKGARPVDPTTSQQVNGTRLSESELRPLDNAPAPGKPFIDGADVNINLAITVNGTSSNSTANRYSINGASWMDPKVPVFLQILSGAQLASDLLPAGSIYALPQNKVIQLTLPVVATDPGNPHPFHLHGHAFAVVRSAGNTSAYNFVNPIRRDVVSMGQEPGSNVTIRFTSDNPGPWFLHCHINWHLQRGLAVVMVDAPGQTALKNKFSLDWTQLCPIYNALPLPLQNP